MRWFARLGMIAVIAVAVVSVVMAGLDRPSRVEVAGPNGAGPPGRAAEFCEGRAEGRDPSSAEGLRYLPAWLPPGLSIERAWARAELLTMETCPLVPTVLAAARFPATGRDRMEPVLRLKGPSPTPYLRYPGPDYKSVSVRGVMGERLEKGGPGPTGRSITLRWTEPSGGGSWQLETLYLDEADVVKIADQLKLPAADFSAPASAGWLPPGLEITFQRQRPMPQPPDEVFWWHAVMGGDAHINLAIHQAVPDDPLISRFSASDEVQFVEVRGHQARAGFLNGNVQLAWEERPGVVVELTGKLDLRSVVRIAESLEPVAADDPRIG